MQPARFLIRSIVLFSVFSLIGIGCVEDLDDETDTSLHPLQRAGVAAKKKDDYCDRASKRKVPDHKAMICHIPPGNPANAHTIIVGKPSVPAHLAHGDTLGPCGCDDNSRPGKGPKSNGNPGTTNTPGDSTGNPGTTGTPDGDDSTSTPGSEGGSTTTTTSIPGGYDGGDDLTSLTPSSTPSSGQYDGGGHSDGETCSVEDQCLSDSDCGFNAYCDFHHDCCTEVFL